MTKRYMTHDRKMEILAERWHDQDTIAELRAALEGLFEHCAMVHKHWGDGDNTRAADAAIANARAAIAKATT